MELGNIDVYVGNGRANIYYALNSKPGAWTRITNIHISELQHELDKIVKMALKEVSK